MDLSGIANGLAADAGSVVTLGINFLVQSTVLIGLGLLAARRVRRMGAAYESVLLRAVLVGVLVCPLGAGLLRLAGLPTVSFALPGPVDSTDDGEVPAMAVGSAVSVLDLGIEPAVVEAPVEPSAVDGVALATAAVEVSDEAEPPGAAEAASPDLNAWGWAYSALAAAWVALASVLLLRLGVLHVRLVRARRAGRTAEEPVQRICRELAGGLGLRPPPVRLSDRMAVPCLVGALRPTILLPAPAVPGPGALRYVLLHELVHLRQRDCLWNLLGHAAGAVFWFQPLLRVLRRRIERASDDVCDDHVLAASRDRRDYASCLLAIAERLQPPGPEAVLATPMASSQSALARRVDRILDASRRLSVRSGSRAVSAVALLVSTAVVVLGFIGLRIGAAEAVLTSQPQQEVEISPDDAVKRLVEGLRANREQLKCGALSWSWRNILEGLVPELSGRHETVGVYKLWWDGEKLATTYIQDQRIVGPEQQIRHRLQAGGSSYDGSPGAKRPRLNIYEHWLQDVARCMGDGSHDKLLLKRRQSTDIAMECVLHESADGGQLKLVGSSQKEGGKSIEWYDVSRGCNLVKQEWYDSENRLYMRRTDRLYEVAKGVWLSVDVDMKSFGAEGKVGSHQRLTLDLDRCSFNDPSLIPAGIFSLSPREIEHQYQAELKEAYEKARGRKADSEESAEEAMEVNETTVLRQLISRLADAAAQGDEAAVVRLLDKRRYQASAADVIKDLKEAAALGATPAIVSSVNIHGNHALIVTEFFEVTDSRYRGKQCLVYRVNREASSWLIEDIDMEDVEGLIEKVRLFDKLYKN